MEQTRTVVLLIVGSLLWSCSSTRKTPEERLDGQSIAETIQKHLPEIKTCFEPAAKRDPQLKGLVRTQFIIGTDGKVVEANVIESTLNHKATEDCIAKAVETWKFPEPPQGQTVEVKYPFLLRVQPNQVADHLKRHQTGKKQ